MPLRALRRDLDEDVTPDTIAAEKAAADELYKAGVRERIQRRLEAEKAGKSMRSQRSLITCMAHAAIVRS